MKKHLPGILITAVILVIGYIYGVQKDSDFIEETPKDNLLVIKTYDYKDQSLLPLHSKAMEHYRQREFSRMRDYFEEIIYKGPDEPNAHYGLGIALIWLKDYTGAEMSFRRALELAPGTAPANMGLGHVAKWREQYDLSIEYYKKALNDRPNYVAAHRGIAYVYYRLQNYELSKEHYRKIIKLAPGTHMAEKAKARIAEIDQYKKSQSQYDEVDI